MPRRPLGILALLGLLLPPVAARADDPDPSLALFEPGLVPTLRIAVEKDQLDKLRGDQRSYVEATIAEEGQPPVGPIGIKLKGAAGSFRDWNDRPALTVNMGKFRKKLAFHGLTKFHLNNSVQDPSYLNEAVMADLFDQAGLPAPRVTHARVFLNGRDVGLYVLKEGVDRRFLARSFPDPTGNLYDGGFCQDVNADLEKDEGSGGDDRGDLKALAAATQEPDPARRRERLEAVLDVDAFCGFMALERIGVHWDGYSGKANNYRVYFDPRTRRATFLPHGMDQMFQEPNWGLFEATGPLVSDQILRDDAFRRRYRAQLARMAPLIETPDRLFAKIDAIVARVRPVLEASDPNWVAGQRDAAEGLKGRIVARAASVRQQLDAAEETTLDFDDRGVARLPKGWRPKADSGRADLAQEEGDPPAFRIAAAEGGCVASWRRRVVFGPGRYIFRVMARTEGVEAPAGTDNVGVGVGRSGTPRVQHRLGTGPWQEMTFPIVANDDRTSVDLVLELRAARGTVWFDQASLALVRLDGPAAR